MNVAIDITLRYEQKLIIFLHKWIFFEYKSCSFPSSIQSGINIMKVTLILALVIFGAVSAHHGGGGGKLFRRLCKNAPNNQCTWPAWYKEVRVGASERCPPANAIPGLGRSINEELNEEEKHWGGGFFNPNRRNICSTVTIIPTKDFQLSIR